MRFASFFVSSLFYGFLLSARAYPAEEISKIIVTDELASKKSFQVFAPEKKTARIHSGKKSSSTDLTERPAQTDQNLRQTLVEVPGLLVSEVPNQSLTSFNYRGIGDPHEGFNIQTLEDGMPISADPYGYPANYYAPPVQSLEGIDFFRGGSALLFGPQAGGALQYRTKSLAPDAPFSVLTQQTGGSFGFFSSYNEITAPIKNTAVRATYVKRQGDGFRDSNQDFNVDYAQLKTATYFGNTLFTSKFDYYNADHGEPGGLATQPDTNVRSITEGIRRSTLNSDRLFIDRKAINFSTETELNSSTSFVNRLQIVDYNRTSRRQALGTGIPTFGGIASGTTNTIQDQDFFNLGLDSRLLKQLSKNYRISTGLFAFNSKSNYLQKTGDSPTALDGDLARDLDRTSRVFSAFTELEATYGNWKIVPGMRLESIHQNIKENTDTTNSGALRNESRTNWVPLFGIGVERSLDDSHQAYANASQGYRPVVFQESVPLLQGATISADLKPQRSLNYEAGVRKSVGKFSWDLSSFLIRYTDQSGRIGTQYLNLGNATYYGAEASGGLQLGEFVLPGVWYLYSSLTYLKAKYTRGITDGKTPQYAPDWMNRVRLEHRVSDRYRWSIIGTTLSGHFADDGNTANQRIPGYTVWDLATEADVYKNSVALIVNIQNMFNRNYWSRVRSNGIDPASPFNIQAGVRFSL